MKNRITAFILFSVMLLTVFIQTFEFVSLDKSNIKMSTSIEKIDDKNAIIHYKNIGSSSEDILVKKNMLSDKYYYVFYDLNTNKKLCSFNSEQDIKLDDNIILNDGKLCAAVAVKAVISGDDVWTALAAALGGAMAYIGSDLVATIGALIAESGIAVIPEIIGLLSIPEILAVVGGAVGLA